MAANWKLAQTRRDAEAGRADDRRQRTEDRALTDYRLPILPSTFARRETPDMGGRGLWGLWAS
jgi:hypothetical protein